MRIQKFPVVLIAALCGAAANTFAAVQIVDIVPASMEKESVQNSEPNIAVNPANPNEIAISAFGAKTPKNPIFLTADGGSSWKRLQYIRSFDCSLDWSASGHAYLAHLTGGGGTVMASAKLRKATGGYRFTNLPGNYVPGRGGPDQPWIQAVKVGTKDHVYIGFNDLSKASRTASIRFSLDDGQTWQNTVIEHTVPGLSQDGSCVRVGVKGTTVYGVFERFNDNSGQVDVSGDVVLTRDDNSGKNHFNDLPAVTIASNQIFPQSDLGDERLGSDLSIAVDPNDAAHVYVAFATGSTPKVVVYESKNSGTSWSLVYTAANNTGLPALAVTTNSVVGLLFTKYASGNLETHLIRTNDDFSTAPTDTTLSRFTNGNPASQFDPYIGDYEDLAAVGTTFYGTFCASNNTSKFPTQPTFLRNESLLGGSVDYSIDPFFFTVTTVTTTSGTSGGTLTLNGSNTYSGTTTTSGGTLNLGASGSTLTTPGSSDPGLIFYPGTLTPAASISPDTLTPVSYSLSPGVTLSSSTVSPGISP
jgi:autotransporter-associated beta strand protein